MLNNLGLNGDTYRLGWPK